MDGAPRLRRHRRPLAERCQPSLHRRTDPGTSPSGMKLMMSDEDDAEHQVPAHDIGAHHVLHDDDDGGAGDRPEQGRGAAGDHHQQHLGRGLQRRHLRADELVVVDEQQPGDAGPEAGEQEREEADQPDVVAERVHAARLVARAAQAGAERRAHEQRPSSPARRGRRSASRNRTASALDRLMPNGTGRLVTLTPLSPLVRPAQR